MNKLIKEDNHNVRLFFDHGNPITLDLKGCGSLYIHPGKDYFFYNAPIRFIDYIIQLKRLGVSYKLTSDKKGCFMSIDLQNFESRDPRNILGGIRENVKNISNKAEVVTEIISEPTIEIKAEDTIVIAEPPIVIEEESTEVTPTEIEEAIEKNTEPTIEEKVLSPEEISRLNKTDLISYAKKLGHEEASDLMTKKDIIKLISE